MNIFKMFSRKKPTPSKKTVKDIINVSKEGRVWVESKDFFGLSDVKDLMSDLREIDIVKRNCGNAGKTFQG